MGTSENNEWQAALSAIDLSAIDALKTLKAEQDVLDERLKTMENLQPEGAAAG